MGVMMAILWQGRLEWLLPAVSKLGYQTQKCSLQVFMLLKFSAIR